MVSEKIQNQQLLSVLQARCDEAQVFFREVCERIAQTTRVLEQLNQPSEVEDVKYRTLGADVLWRHWVERRRTTIMSELALLYAKREEAGERLRKANGKAKAFEAVLMKKQKTEELTNRRKAEGKLNALLLAQEFEKKS